MQQQPELVTVTISVDRWSGPVLVSSLLGAWSTAHTFKGGALLDVLEHCRDALGSRWVPASPQDIERAFQARQRDAVPWEQYSLF